MNFFEFTDKELFFRNDGELVIIAAWGDNSLRVQSSLMDKIPDGNAALINPNVNNPSDIDIRIIDERHAVIKTDLSQQNYMFRNGEMLYRFLFITGRINFCFVKSATAVH